MSTYGKPYLGYLFDHVAYATNELRDEFFLSDRRIIDLVLWNVTFQLHVLCIHPQSDMVYITHVYRTWFQQDKIYGDLPSYRENPKPSLHMARPCLAADGVTPHMDLRQTGARLVEYAEQRQPYGKKPYKSILVHQVEGAIHCHHQAPEVAETRYVKGCSQYVPKIRKE